MGRLLALLSLLLAALAAQAPAWLVTTLVRPAAGGFIELADPAGTVWNGTAHLAVRGGAALPAHDAGSMRWRLDGFDFGQRALRFRVTQQPPAVQPLLARIGTATIHATGAARLPAALLVATPWTPGWVAGGDLQVRTGGVDWSAGAARGEAVLAWSGASLRPAELDEAFDLGELEARVLAHQGGIDLTIANRGGAFAVSGTASPRTGAVALQVQPRGAMTTAQRAWLDARATSRGATGYTFALAGMRR